MGKNFISLSQDEVLGFGDQFLNVNVTKLKRHFYYLIGNVYEACKVTDSNIWDVDDLMITVRYVTEIFDWVCNGLSMKRLLDLGYPRIFRIDFEGFATSLLQISVVMCLNLFFRLSDRDLTLIWTKISEHFDFLPTPWMLSKQSKSLNHFIAAISFAVLCNSKLSQLKSPNRSVLSSYTFSFIRLHSQWVLRWLELQVFLIRRGIIGFQLCEFTRFNQFRIEFLPLCDSDTWQWYNFYLFSVRNSFIDLKYHGSFQHFPSAYCWCRFSCTTFIIGLGQSSRCWVHLSWYCFRGRSPWLAGKFEKLIEFPGLTSSTKPCYFTLLFITFSEINSEY